MRLKDADALLNDLEDLLSYVKLGKEHSYYNGEANALNVIIGKIKDAPTVDAVPVKHGRWTDDNCSVCGQYVYHGDARNYCPNCGAKMDGERRENE